MVFYRAVLKLHHDQLLDALFGLGKLKDRPNGLTVESIIDNPVNKTVLIVLRSLERQWGSLRFFETAKGQEPPQLDYHVFMRDQ